MLKSTKPYAEQLPGIQLLYQHLCTHLPERYQSQIDDYVLHITTVRSGGILPDGVATYPYDIKLEGKRLVLCNAGTFGQQMYSKLVEHGCQIMAWVDDDYWACRRCCLDVDPVEAIRSLEVDYAVVAALDYHACENWKSRLLELGIRQEQICIINRDPAQRKLALCNYLGLLAD